MEPEETMPDPPAPPPDPPPESFQSAEQSTWGMLKSLASGIKERGLKETVREKATAVSEHDWRGSAAGLGRRIGSYVVGSIEGEPTPPPDLRAEDTSSENAPELLSDGEGRLRQVSGYLVGVASTVAADPRGVASAAVGKAREVGEKAREVAGSAVCAVKERAQNSETLGKVVERTGPLVSRALEKGSVALEKGKEVAHVGLEKGREVAGRAAEVYAETNSEDVKEAIKSVAHKGAHAARTHTPAVVATAGGAIGAGLGAIGNTVGAAAGAAAGVAAAHVAHMRLRRAMKDAGVEGVEVIRLSEALGSAGSGSALEHLEMSSVASTDLLRQVRTKLGENERIAAEAATLYLHGLFDDACSAPSPPSHPAPAARPKPPRLHTSASLAYAAVADAALRGTSDATAKLEAYRRRAAVLRTQVAAAGEVNAGADASEVARQRPMAVYSARSLVAAACTCVSELAAASVHALGEVGGLSLRSIVSLDTELVKQHELAVHRAAPLSTALPAEVRSDDSPLLSAGGTACALGSALLQEVGVLVGSWLAAARACREIVLESSNLLQMQELKAPLAALDETLDAFEAGLAVDVSEVRQQISEALRHLLPICSLLQPPAEYGAPPHAPVLVGASALAAGKAKELDEATTVEAAMSTSAEDAEAID